MLWDDYDDDVTDVHDGREPYTGQVGGRVSATTWPLRSGNAIDIFFDGKDSAYPAGYYRGVIDTATTPSKTGIQKLDVDFPDDRTSARLDLKRSHSFTVQQFLKRLFCRGVIPA